ncbi:MAG: hypothetical protein B6I24_06640 [Bacteroidetes bacterium 4572_128]|nr:MAG: hypothetical protein B6I24_06640 [Bacteroidetes bacterium 4572_128]
MPILSKFLGIIIKIFVKDHPPPHFHAKYAEYKCSVNIDNGEVIAGKMPPKQKKELKKWSKKNKKKLLKNWEEAQKGNPKLKEIK